MENTAKKLLSSKKVLIITIIIGVFLVIFSDQLTKPKASDSYDINYYSSDLEKRVENLILAIEGIERVSVLITLEDSGETVYAQNESKDYSEYVLFSVNGGENGLKLEEINPTVRGVAVVCNNGDDIHIKEKIISILSSALGIPTNKITVAG